MDHQGDHKPRSCTNCVHLYEVPGRAGTKRCLVLHVTITRPDDPRCGGSEWAKAVEVKK